MNEARGMRLLQRTGALMTNATLRGYVGRKNDFYRAYKLLLAYAEYDVAKSHPSRLVREQLTSVARLKIQFAFMEYLRVEPGAIKHTTLSFKVTEGHGPTYTREATDSK